MSEDAQTNNETAAPEESAAASQSSLGEIRSRVKTFKRVPAKELEPHPLNWRRHPQEQVDAMRAALDEIGFAGAIVVRETEPGRYQIIDGHLRSEIDPEARVPILVTDLSAEEADKLLATFDPIGSMAVADREALQELLSHVTFEAPELEGLVDSILDATAIAGDSVDEAAAPDGWPAPTYEYDHKCPKCGYRWSGGQESDGGDDDEEDGDG